MCNMGEWIKKSVEENKSNNGLFFGKYAYWTGSHPYNKT